MGSEGGVTAARGLVRKFRARYADLPMKRELMASRLNF